MHTNSQISYLATIQHCTAIQPQVDFFLIFLNVYLIGKHQK
jgi:hypothetical protein